MLANVIDVVESILGCLKTPNGLLEILVGEVLGGLLERLLELGRAGQLLAQRIEVIGQPLHTLAVKLPVLETLTDLCQRLT